MNWDDLKIFLAVARSASLSQAAAELRVNQSTVSRRLSALETALGVSLVDRSGRARFLTGAGKDLLAQTLGVESGIDHIVTEFSGRDARLAGMLRITCTDALATHYLAPRLAEFTRRFPDVSLELVTVNQPLDLMRREADIALRVTTHPPGDAVGRRIGAFAMAAYCADIMPPSALPDDLDWIGWPGSHPTNDMIADTFPMARPRHRADSVFAAAEMVRLGMGASVFACYWADRMPGLRRIGKTLASDAALSLWMLTHPETRHAARVRAMLDYLYPVLKSDRGLFAGGA